MTNASDAPAAVPRESYDRILAVNWSTLKLMGRSPAAYWHGLHNPLATTPAMLFGLAGHTATFEPDKFGTEFAIWTGDRKAGKEWEVFKAEAGARKIIGAEDAARALAVRDAVRAHPAAAAALYGTVPEYTITWTDPVTGIACKGRCDAVGMDRRIVVDLKITQDPTPRAFAQSVAKYEYHGQLAFYGMGLGWGDDSDAQYVLIAVESHPPHDVIVYTLGAAEIWAGERLARAYLRRVAECRAANYWPGYSADPVPLGLPAWAYSDEEDAAGLGLIFKGEA